MEIRKKFKFEMAHIVRNAWSQRCAHSIHGHSYELEIFFECDLPDRGGMVLDFGLVKKYMNDFIDSFDHSTFLWNRSEDKPVIDFFLDHFERVVVSPFPTSAEVQAEMFLRYAQKMISYLIKKEKLGNEEGMISVSRAIVHETKTGYAEARADGFEFMIPKDKDKDLLSQLFFSESIKSEWKDPETVIEILNHEY